MDDRIGQATRKKERYSQNGRECFRAQLGLRECRITDSPLTCRLRSKGFVEDIRLRRQVAQAASVNRSRFPKSLAADSRSQLVKRMSSAADCYAAPDLRFWRYTRRTRFTSCGESNSDATSGSRTTTFEPLLRRSTYFPRTPSEKSYSSSISPSPSPHHLFHLSMLLHCMDQTP